MFLKATIKPPFLPETIIPLWKDYCMYLDIIMHAFTRNKEATLCNLTLIGHECLFVNTSKFLLLKQNYTSSYALIWLSFILAVNSLLIL
jgi:hypothetical protein